MPAALTLMTTTVSDPSTRHSLALALLTTTATTNAPPATLTANLTTLKLLPGAYTLLDLTRVPLSLSLPPTTT